MTLISQVVERVYDPKNPAPWTPGTSTDVKERIRERARKMGVRFDERGEPIIGAPIRPAPTDGGPDCERCNNQRYIPGEGGLVRCPACGVADQRAIQSLQRYSSASGRAAGQTFDNFKIALDGRTDSCLEFALQAAKDFAAEVMGFLVIYGPPGNGKSHLCAAIGHAITTYRHRPVVFVTMPDLLASLKALMDPDANEANDTYTSRLETYQRCPVLILDDVGAEKRSEWADGVLLQIVDWRYRNRLPSVFVTNLDPFSTDDFDARTVTRWTDAELAVVAQNAAPNYRNRELEER